MSQVFIGFVILATAFVVTSVEGHDTTSTQQLCVDVVSKLDCSLDPPRNICGNNGVTYRTSCEFAKAHCADLDIHIRYYGACAESDKPDVICTELLALTCPTTNNSVCASDGVSYNDFCRYQQAKCRSPGLSLVSLGPCPTEPPTPTASLFELICQVILTEQCPTGQPQVCGSDGNTYGSGCELEKANCQDSTSIYLQKEGPC
ncbi:hypothetical protein RRG08_056493 [Elysia crispata]|uniref:Kazal-like domain-containing protein n=1 Tax=Elysia crispata TaxID=231223 RepID=A0AAE1CJ99_9GAST|nr:hypothetical protein RRG08_056493 [Elysia crispata]